MVRGIMLDATPQVTSNEQRVKNFFIEYSVSRIFASLAHHSSSSLIPLPHGPRYSLLIARYFL
jgi:hypothetical protein